MSILDLHLSTETRVGGVLGRGLARTKQLPAGDAGIPECSPLKILELSDYFPESHPAYPLAMPPTTTHRLEPCHSALIEQLRDWRAQLQSGGWIRLG